MKSRPKALRTTRKGARSSFSIHAKGEKQSCREPPKRKRTWKPRSQTFRRRIRNSRTSLTLSPISWRPQTMTTRTMITATMATMTTTETTTRTDPGPELWAVAQGNAERNRPRPPLRANHCPPPGQPICAFCGSTRYVEVGHLDGFARRNGGPMDHHLLIRRGCISLDVDLMPRRGACPGGRRHRDYIGVGHADHAGFRHQPLAKSPAEVALLLGRSAEHT